MITTNDTAALISALANAPGVIDDRMITVNKMKRLITILIACIAGMNISCAAQAKIGNAEVPVPAGWQEVVDDKERINLISPDNRQQATISVMGFETSPSFEDFKRLCEIRLKAEKTEAPDISITANEPFDDGENFGMSFSGNEKAAGRLFSGYLVLKDKEQITIYVESIGVDSRRHLQTFEELVKGLKWR